MTELSDQAPALIRASFAPDDRAAALERLRRLHPPSAEVDFDQLVTAVLTLAGGALNELDTAIDEAAREVMARAEQPDVQRHPGPPAAAMSSVWVVIPTYDEAANLEALLDAVRVELPGATMLVVDDNSPDGTGVLADALALTHTDVRVLHRPAKAGLGGAYLAGFAHARAARADFVCQIDGDFSHNPADLGRLVAAAEAGHDVVIGSRYVDAGATGADWPRARRALSRAAGVYARVVLGLDVCDPTSGYRCYSARALDALDLVSVEAHGYAFQVELTYRAARAGLRVAEIPITFAQRRSGRSKMSMAITIEALWRIPSWRWRLH